MSVNDSDARQKFLINYLTLNVSTCMSQVNLYDVIFENYNCFGTRQWRMLYPNGGSER